jgi:hypothetical protein
MKQPPRSYATAAERWAGVGPYYAMFPSWFSDTVIREFTEPGDTVLDPFAGRGTAIFSAATQERHGLGIEINPVGWVYARTKLAPADEELVRHRIAALGNQAWRYRGAAKDLPLFFRLCFSLDIRAFLLTARSRLNWRQSATDRTVMALMLIHLHGKAADSLSNQLRQTKAMSPDYAIRWWRERSLTPPQHEPVEFLLQRLHWRYAKGRPNVRESSVYLGDSLRILPRLAATPSGLSKNRPRLLFTSPPYLNIANYHYDQWLRLWLLGGPPNANRNGHRFRGKFENLDLYESLLRTVFRSSASVLHHQGIVYVRTSQRPDTYRATVDALKGAFPSRSVSRRLRPFRGPTQTQLFGDRAAKKGEVDLVLYP